MANNDIKKEYNKILYLMFEKNKKDFNANISDKQKVFISFTYGLERAKTFRGIGNTLETAFLNAKNAVIKSIKNEDTIPIWTYMDFVSTEEKITKDEFYQRVNNTKINYYRYGISFDDYYQMSFLEQEINGAVLFDNTHSPIILNDKNITSLLRKKGLISRMQEFLQSKLEDVIVFKCKSYFFDAKEDKYYDLYSSGLEKGIRKIVPDKQFWIEQIKATGKYLNSTVNDDGSFIYGYFPCFGKIVPTYNITRHCLSVIALIEVYEFWPDDSLKENIDKTFNYVIREALKDIDDEHAVIVDHANNDEIRLGALGLAILMILQYSDFINSDQYLHIAKKLANSIIKMHDPKTGEFTHVLQYPDMSVKEKFKIVYYSGEACYGLMKLYERIKDKKYLDVVEKAFDFFIKNNYHKYYDHWLAYSVNELTKYSPEDKYLEFGLKNAMNRIDFIIDRLTTWATFMEMLNAFYHTLETIKEHQKEYLLQPYDMSKFYQAISVRMLRQLNGIMFPEMAMFFKYPAQILYGSYIRHHSFRIRNDDVAHHLIGYCHFVKDILPYSSEFNLFPKQANDLIKKGD